MTDWTVERLEALPQGVALMLHPSRRWFVRVQEGWWEIATGVGAAMSSAELLDRPVATVRVVSVPVDSLLTDEAVEAARWHSGLGSTRYGIERMLRAAVGHATGGLS